MEIKKSISRNRRRTNAELDQDMMSAIETIVCVKGFTNIPFMEFVKQANIDSSVFYRRFDSIYDMYEQLAKKYDFWLSSLIDIAKLQELGDKEFLLYVFKSLHKNIVDNPIMQKLLLWELTETNDTTKHTAQFRDTVNSNLVVYYKMKFDPIGIDIASIFSIFITSIYYLTLHRGIATFCLIDFSSKEGYKQLDNAIAFLIEVLFEKLDGYNKLVDTVKNMAEDGIPHSKIYEYRT